LDLSKDQAPVPKHLQTPEELSRLALLAQQGDADAMMELFWRVRPLAYNMALKFGHGRGSEEGHEWYSDEERRDILQAAWVGLAEAVSRWDPDHPKGKGFWSVASYRIDIEIKEWQGRNTGSVPTSRFNWEQRGRSQRALEAQNVPEWEALGRDDLHAITGIRGAYDILRAFQGKQGHVNDEDLEKHSPSAEEAYWADQDEAALHDLLQWLHDLEAIPEERWEEAVYWKLEQLGLAGNIEAAELVELREVII